MLCMDFRMINMYRFRLPLANQPIFFARTWGNFKGKVTYINSEPFMTAVDSLKRWQLVTCEHVWVNVIPLMTAERLRECRILDNWNAYQLICSWVCVRLSHFSQLSFMQYMGLCVFIPTNSFAMIVRICVLYLIIIITSEVWIINHCLGLSHKTIVRTVRLAICPGMARVFSDGFTFASS